MIEKCKTHSELAGCLKASGGLGATGAWPLLNLKRGAHSSTACSENFAGIWTHQRDISMLSHIFRLIGYFCLLEVERMTEYSGSGLGNMNLL